MLGNKNFYKKCKSQRLFNKKDFFFFSTFLRFHAANIKEFHSICELLMLLNALKKLKTKDFFLATDATTQSSNQEENETRIFFLFHCKITQQGKMLTRTKPREWKENSGLKHRSQTESEHKNAKKQSKQHQF